MFGVYLRWQGARSITAHLRNSKSLVEPVYKKTRNFFGPEAQTGLLLADEG
jgi:hypothetical protein